MLQTTRLVAALAVWLAAAQLWAEPVARGPDALNAATLNALNAGDVEQALDNARAAVAAARGSEVRDPYELAYALNNLGYALMLAGDAAGEDPAAALDEAISITEHAGLTASDPWLLAMMNRANLSAERADEDEAAALISRMLEVGRGMEVHGRAVAAASAFHFENGRYTEAARLLEELLAVQPELLNASYGAVYTAYASAQEAAEARGRMEDAIALIEGRIAILDAFEIAGGDEAIQNLLWQKFFQLHEAGVYGRAADALRAWGAAAPLSKEELRYVDEMATLSLEATQLSSYAERREVQLGSAQLAVAFAGLTGIPDDPRLGRALREVAAALSRLGRHDDAARALHRTARIFKATGEGRKSLHWVLADLAANAWQRLDYALADKLYRQARLSYEAALEQGAAPLEPIDLSIMAINRAKLLIDMGRAEEALALTEEAWRHFRRDAARGPQKWNSRAQALHIHSTAALALAELGRGDDAIAEIEAALSVAREALPDNHPDLALALANAADLLLSQGADARAVPLLEEAVAIHRRTLPPGLPIAVETEVKLALYFVTQGRLDAALPLLRRIAEARKSPVYRSHLPGAAGNFETFAWALLDRTTKPDPQDIDEAFSALQWTQVTRSAEALSMMEARLAVAEPLQAVWLRRRQDLREAVARNTSRLLAAYAAASSEEVIKGLHTRHDRLEDELTQTERMLASFGLETAGLTGVEPLSVASVQALLEPGEALVTFLLPGLRPESITGLDGSSNHVIAMTRDIVSVARIPEVSRGRLNRRIQAFRCEVAVSDPGCAGGGAAALRGAMLEGAGDDGAVDFGTEIAHNLYRDLFGGIESTLANVTHLIRVPPADLLRLPFQALVAAPATDDDSGNIAWLIRRHAVSVLPSVTSLRTLRQGPARQGEGLGRLLGLGDPIIGTVGPVDCSAVRVAALRAAPDGFGDIMAAANDSGAALARPAALKALPRLPDATCELQAIARVFAPGAVTLHLGEAATESRIKAIDAAGELVGYDILVFATHGLTAGEAGAHAPGLVLTPPAEATIEDDGLLTAAEVAGLNLNARLVVLSACNTAAGENPEAEGLSGLARAFFYAGGATLLVTHWSVYSAAAVEISTGLFSELHARPGLIHAEALRRSVLAILDDPVADPMRKHPSYWGAFAVVGAR